MRSHYLRCWRVDLHIVQCCLEPDTVVALVENMSGLEPLDRVTLGFLTSSFMSPTIITTLINFLSPPTNLLLSPPAQLLAPFPVPALLGPFLFFVAGLALSGGRLGRLKSL